MTVLKYIIANLQVVAGAADAISACVVDEEVRETDLVSFVIFFGGLYSETSGGKTSTNANY